jgi:hypothetical protein
MKKEQIMYHDVLAGIFYFLHKRGKALGSRTDLHENIYNLQQNDKFSLLRDFNFSTDGIFPVSNEIEDSLFSLLLSNMIYFKNPHYVEIELGEESEKAIKRDIFDNKFSQKEINQMEKIAIAY